MKWGKSVFLLFLPFFGVVLFSYDRIGLLVRNVGGKRELDARLVCLGVGCSGFLLDGCLLISF